MHGAQKRSKTARIATVLFLGAAVAAPQATGAQGLGNMFGKILPGKTLGAPPAAGNAAPSGASNIGQLLSVATSSQSDTEEVTVGEGVAATVLGAAKPWTNEKAQRYVNLVGRRIAQHAERASLPWTFAVVDTNTINAFAAPGGIVLVTRGLYELLETEDELAAILAHEIGHVVRQHHYNVIKQQKLVQFGAGVIQQGSSGNSALTNKLVSLGAEVLARGLDKGAEFEADRDAMVLAARAGYDSSAILRVLEKLRARTASDSSMQLMFATHPGPNERIDRLVAALTSELEEAAVPSRAGPRIGQDGR